MPVVGRPTGGELSFAVLVSALRVARFRALSGVRRRPFVDEIQNLFAELFEPSRADTHLLDLLLRKRPFE